VYIGTVLEGERQRVKEVKEARIQDACMHRTGSDLMLLLLLPECFPNTSKTSTYAHGTYIAGVKRMCLRWATLFLRSSRTRVRPMRGPWSHGRA
jgi:hypothetical protein